MAHGGSAQPGLRPGIRPGGGRLRGMTSRLRVNALLLALCLLAAACARAGQEPGPVVLGVGSTAEQRMLAALTVVALDRAGVAVEARPDLGGTVGLRREALRGHIDLWWDYTGAAWALGMGEQAPPADAQESWERVRRADEDRGLTWLEPTAADATLALFVRAAELPPEGQPRGLSWLAGVLSRGEAKLCADADFARRSGGLDALAEAYAIDLNRLSVAAADEATAIGKVADGSCFAGLATATSGEARAAGLLPVADELGVFPAFVVAPVARAAALERHPAVAGALRSLAGVLDTRALGELNREVAAGRDPAGLAEAFLEQGSASPG